jgi:hypothetical protein
LGVDPDNYVYDTIGGDRNNHSVGEEAQLVIGVGGPGANGHVRIVDGNGNVIEDFGQFGDEPAYPRFTMPSEPGDYFVTVDGDRVQRFEVTDAPHTEPGDRLGDPRNIETGEDDPDAANIPGLVSGDEGGLVLAPSLRRQGYTAENLGGEITIGGETFGINPADTVVRDPGTGEAVNRGPGGESGAPGEDPSQRVTDADRSGSGGLLGAGLGALVLVAAGAAALMGGD